MKIEQSETRKIKYKAMFWLRIDQRCMFIATEVGKYSADVLGINEKKMIEIEVKTSIEDFKNDFKKLKHFTYGDETSRDQWIPTHFYFAMPEILIPEARAFLEVSEKRGVKKYGLISSDSWSVVKRAQWLHKNSPTNTVKTVCALRMGSELIRFHEAWL